LPSAADSLVNEALDAGLDGSHPVTVHAKMLRLELLSVKADLERELAHLVLDCSRCDRTVHWVAGLGIVPAIGRTENLLPSRARRMSVSNSRRDAIAGGPDSLRDLDRLIGQWWEEAQRSKPDWFAGYERPGLFSEIHSAGFNTFRWSVNGDTLTLEGSTPPFPPLAASRKRCSSVRST
jgi:hypothetical protein